MKPTGAGRSLSLYFNTGGDCILSPLPGACVEELASFKRVSPKEMKARDKRSATPGHQGLGTQQGHSSDQRFTRWGRLKCLHKSFTR